MKKDLSDLDPKIKELMVKYGYPLTFQGFLDFNLNIQKQISNQQLKKTQEFCDSQIDASKERIANNKIETERELKKINDDFFEMRANNKKTEFDNSIKAALALIENFDKSKQSWEMKLELLKNSPFGSNTEYKATINKILLEKKIDFQL